MNSLFTRFAVIIAFFTVSFGANAQSIGSTLNNRPGVFTNAEQQFAVSTVAGPSVGTNVTVKITLANPAQASSINLDYFNPLTSTYQDITFDANGVGSFGPGAGFPFMDLTSNFKVVFSAPGTYAYTLTVTNTANSSTVTGASESVVVNTQPTIAGSINGQTLYTGQLTNYNVSTTAGSMAGTLVKVFFKANDPSQTANFNVEYFEISNSTWVPITFSAGGTFDFGPASGFPLGNNTTQFRVTYNTAGTYGYKMSVYRAGGAHDTLAVSNETVTVVDYIAPTIASDINGATLFTATEKDYAVTTTAGSEAGNMVRVFFKLADNSQAPNVNISYEAVPGTFLPLPIAANGTGSFGPGAGFPLANTATNFKVTFDAPGTYTYKMSVYEAGGTHDTLATATETVTVIDYVATTIASTLDGQTVNEGAETAYDINVTAGSQAGETVRVFFKLADASQAAATHISYETLPGTFNNLTLDANGIGYFGDVTGFSLSDLSINTKAIFDDPGTYTYKMSIYKVANNDTIATVTETVNVADVQEASISSDLDGQTVFKDAETDYAVTTTAGDYAGDMVRVFFELTDAGQASNVNISYEATPGNFQALVIDANGQGYFGPGAGFPLGDLSTNFKVTFSATGTYEYKMSVYKVSNQDTIATATESVTVVDYVAPTIASDLDGQTVTTGDETAFAVTTTAGSDVNKLVRVFIKFADASQVADVNLSYETTPGTFAALPIDPAGFAFFGPASGFPLADLSSNFKVTFDAAGVYDYKLSVFEVSSTDTLAVSEESVTVVDPTPLAPVIYSTLNNMPNVAVDNEKTFTVTTEAGDITNENVRIRFTLNVPAQGDSINLLFQNPANSNFEQLTFDAAGVAYAGSSTGFAIADEDYNFKVSFLGGGLYKYTVALVKASDNTVLADSSEQVFVLDNSGIDEQASIIGSVFPNPTEGSINVQTKGNGAGTLDVVTLTGQKVMAKNINGPTHTVSLEQLPAGVYIIRITQDGKSSVVRVVKK